MKSLLIHDRVLRLAASWIIVCVVFSILSLTPLRGPLGGVIGMATLLACSWFGGPTAAATLPSFVALISRVFGSETKPFWPTGQELLTITLFTILTSSVGMAGQYRRRLHAATQRHQSRQREQARALAAARIVFTDLCHCITGWTAGAEQLYGWAAGEAQGRNLHELLETRFPEAFPGIEALLKGDGQWQGEVRQRHKSGSELIVACHWILSRDDDGSPVGIAQICNDVTALRAAESAARDADRRKDLFLALLAHELRNPLAPLRSGLDLLSLRPDRTEDEREIHFVMHRQLQQLVRLIDDLLEVSRLNTGRVKLQRERLDLADVLQHVVADVRAEVAAAELECRLTLPDQPLPIDADRARLTQVIMNLVNNAVKFTPAGGRIEISAACEGDEAVVRVRDTGIGIRPESLAGLFEMFHQGSEMLVRQHGGLGIGLNIARSLIELHGGKIFGQSAGPGQGSEFTVQLPLAVDTSQDNPDRQNRTSPLRAAEAASDDLRELSPGDGEIAALIQPAC